MALLGVLLGGWAIKTMRDAGTSPSPREPVKALVESGPYRYTRNPIYTSFFLLYSGLAMIANSIWALLLTPVLFLVLNTQVVNREENYLLERFGSGYMEYKERVRRWM